MSAAKVIDFEEARRRRAGQQASVQSQQTSLATPFVPVWVWCYVVPIY